MCVFGVVAVQGGTAPWSVFVLIATVVVCLILVFIVLRQPQSKTQLAFKVSSLSRQIFRFYFFHNFNHMNIDAVRMQ